MGHASTTVLFIAGYGRSGSTLLAAALGSTAGFFNAGELMHVWAEGVLGDRACGCGEPLPSCPVWKAVFEDAYGGFDRDLARRVVSLQAQATRTRHAFTRGQGRRRSRIEAASSELEPILGRLYRSIRTVTGADVVVDSSKVPPYGALLRTFPSFDVPVLHLVRDPRATAHAWRARKKSEPSRTLPEVGVVRSAMLWTTWNLVIERSLGGAGSRYEMMRYEDFVDDPVGKLERVVALAGQPPTTLPFVDRTTLHLEAGHTVAGNPDRFRIGDVPIRRDEAWRTALSPATRYVVPTLALPALRSYGYRWRLNGTAG